MDKGFDEGLQESPSGQMEGRTVDAKPMASEPQPPAKGFGQDDVEPERETGDASPSLPSAAPRPVAARMPYVRQRAPHRSQAAIDDLGQDGAPASSYAHDSNVAVGGKVFSGASKYRRSRGGMGRIQNSRYGQYLEIPKGRRSIFASRERSRRRRSVLSLIVVVALLVVVAVIIWRLLASIG